VGDRRLTLAHSMPWFGHSVQNRDTAHNVWMAMLHVSNRAWRALQRCLGIYPIQCVAVAPWEMQKGEPIEGALVEVSRALRRVVDRFPQVLR
jgi:hypothetical protein